MTFGLFNFLEMELTIEYLPATYVIIEQAVVEELVPEENTAEEQVKELNQDDPRASDQMIGTKAIIKPKVPDWIV
jgi:hypothetical protein